ncbi:protein kinase, putative [Leishmania tarentolae]|uniref:Protein kinase, putative n=1 Tax=Leishmania tarentolae TaxID=5689 RepID=A0A640KM26_LEITA|nr:protein kinase, putative [Leishmania tarentolae]
MAHLFLTGTDAEAAAQLTSDHDDVSPVWSIYDDYGFGASQNEVDDPHVEDEVMNNIGSTAPPRLPFISGPVSSMTLKGAQLKKEAPIRRGAQGAVYSALDVATSAPVKDESEEGFISQEVCRGHGGEELAANGGQRPARRGRRVAVKRIFIQASDFGARDISATVLREITVHRFVSEKQAACLSEAAASYSTSSVSDPAGRAENDQAPVLCNLIDDSARVVHLYRVVEAPHREMCLVMELAATNLEQVLFPHGAHRAPKGDGAGGYRRKPGVVSLFGPSASTGVSGSPDVSSASPSTTSNVAAAEVDPHASSASLPPSRMPLVRYVMRRLLRLVCFLHETCGVVHRDMKLSNVLVAKDGGLRLGDFGSARIIPPLRSATKTRSENSFSLPEPPAASSEHLEHFLCTPPSIRTTLHYRPPEALLGDQACRTAADVWALGVIFAQLLLQRALFRSESELDLLGAIQKLLGIPTYNVSPSWIEAPSVPDPPRGEPSGARVPVPQASLPHKFHAGVVPADGLDLLSRMLHQQPECRITAREALQHPFLNLEGLSATATHDDDEQGQVLWGEKVATVLREQKTGHIYGMGKGEGRPMLVSLVDNEDEEDQDDEEDGVARFCINLGGCESY